VPAFAARALSKAVCTSRNLLSKLFMWFSTAILPDETVAAFVCTSTARGMRRGATFALTPPVGAAALRSAKPRHDVRLRIGVDRSPTSWR